MPTAEECLVGDPQSLAIQGKFDALHHKEKNKLQGTPLLWAIPKFPSLIKLWLVLKHAKKVTMELISQC